MYCIFCAGDAYGGGWTGSGADYAAAAPGYPAGYDYSAYYAQAAAAYGAYGQPPTGYPVADPYAQHYAAAAAAASAAAPTTGSRTTIFS